MVLTFGDNARMAAESTREALTDSLTGLGNRRRLMRDLEDGLAAQHERTIALFDLDGFKNYNDVFGHPAGDALLVRLAEELESVVGRRGAAYRLGGDEFCVLLDGVDEHAEALLADCVVALTDRGHGFDVGCSHGAAKLPEEADDRAAALTLADRRLYSEKFERKRDAISEQTCDALLQVAARARARPARPRRRRRRAGGARRPSASASSRDELDDVRRAAELHDVGKSAVPDAILAKPGPLDEREWEFVRQHTLVGERILRAAPALDTVAKLVRSSHERFDGTGYPDRLAGESIPLGARIVSACDAWDAMITTRPYRKAMASATRSPSCGAAPAPSSTRTSSAALCAEVRTRACLPPRPARQRLLVQREADRAADRGDDPEAQDDLRLRPGAELEVVVDRRHQEHALAERLERGDLDQHRQRLDDEDAAEDDQQHLGLGHHREPRDRAAQPERPRVAHEDRGRERVEPQEADAARRPGRPRPARGRTGAS